MYTQCPDCSTVFRVTAEALRVAQGRVRCGICSASFDALENLSESPAARALDEFPGEDTITVEELPGTEFIELSGTAEPVEDQPDGLAAGTEESLDQAPSDVDTDAAAAGSAEEGAAADLLEDLPETALEFHGSADDLERLFVPAGARSRDAAPPEGLPQAMEDMADRNLSGIEVHEEDLSWPDDVGGSFDPGDPAHVAAVLSSSSSSGAADRGAGEDLEPTDEYPVLVIEDDDIAPQGDLGVGDAPAGSAADDEALDWEEVPGPASDGNAEAREPQADEAPEVPGAAGTSPAEAVEPASETAADEATETEEDTGGGSRDETPLLIIPEELRRGPPAAADDLAAPLDLEEEGPRRWPLAVAAALLAAALAGQAVHHWRQDLVRSPAAGPWMLRAYHAVGLELQPPVDLGRFELRQLGAASDPGQAGRIRVRASIVNLAPFAQPYPLLRLTLQDRFGSTIGARNLGPTEYLPSGAVDASGLLGASQRADAEVVFVDPGREAVGFELDVCMEGDSGLRCSADLPRGAR